MILSLSASVFIFSACGGSSNGSGNAPSAGNTNVNGDRAGVTVNPDEVNRPAANEFDPNTSGVANSQRQLSNREGLTAGDGKNPDGTTGTAKPATRPAPDNSEYWSTLTDIAREYRVFKDHPQIKKVEKSSDGKNVSVKIFTSNGKIINVSGDKFPDISRVSVNEFVLAAGLTPIPVKTPIPGPQTENPEKKGSTAILPAVPR